jgi:hypothetical protein
MTLGRAKIGEGFWPLGFATAVLIKRIFGNGDLESSQQRSGVPGGRLAFRSLLGISVS